MRCLDPNYTVTADPASYPPMAEIQRLSKHLLTQFFHQTRVWSPGDPPCTSAMRTNRRDAEDLAFDLKKRGVHCRVNEVRCRDCGSCLQARARDWAIRFDHESRLYRDRETNEVLGEFMCLTYRDDDLPEHGLLPGREHFSEFRDNLRDHFGETTLAWLGCGEYGERRGRPHYHMALLGHRFRDKYRYLDETLGTHRHPLLEELWPYGHVGTEFIESSSAAATYVSNYTLKGHEYTVTGSGSRRKNPAMKSQAPYRAMHALHSAFADTHSDLAEDDYDAAWSTAEGRTRPFITPITKPGLGLRWLERFWPHVYDIHTGESGITVGNGTPRVKVAPPAAYDRFMRDNHPDVWHDILEAREERRDTLELSTDAEINARRTIFEQRRLAKDKIRDTRRRRAQT